MTQRFILVQNMCNLASLQTLPPCLSTSFYMTFLESSVPSYMGKKDMLLTYTCVRMGYRPLFRVYLALTSLRYLLIV